MMEDLVTTFTNDWDLEAIIRGWGGGGSAYSMADVMEASPPPPASYSGSDPPPLGLEFGGFDADELEATATVLNELELLYKPFLLQHHPPICTDSPTKTEASSPSQADFYGCIDRDDDVDTHELKKPSVADKNPREKASCKRRKSRQKLKVIYRGGGGDDDENLAEMDQWNWRKYGQKSIKGSPYPRSYYRCSSGGGCQARKQVEQSKDEPDAYVVTYMGEHTHPVPTRRRSLAGRKLTKFSSSGTASVDSTGL